MNQYSAEPEEVKKETKLQKKKKKFNKKNESKILEIFERQSKSKIRSPYNCST